MNKKKKTFVVVVVALVVALIAGVVVFASTRGVSGKTILLEDSGFGFIMSNNKVSYFVNELKKRGYDDTRFINQVEEGVNVKDPVSGVTFLTYDGEVHLDEGADIYDIDNVSVDFLIEGEMERGNHRLIGMIDTEFGEFDYFE